MQENYEDGTKGEIKLLAWEDLLEEIKKSLGKDGVRSVTISTTKGLNPGKLVKLEEEKKSLFEELIAEASEKKS